MAENHRQYLLRLYDAPLLAFSFAETAFGEPTAEISWCDESRKHLLPMELLHAEKIAGEDVYRWLSARAIPQNRKNASKIYEAIGVAPNDVQGLVDVCKGLSLNDSYWIADEDFDRRFDEINLYDNGFSEVLGALAVSGHTTESLALSPQSPELTTGGSLPKAWRIEGGKRVLYKGCSPDAAANGGEPFSEYFASQIARRMGLDSVAYGLAEWDGVLCSTCDLFSTKDLSYVSMAGAYDPGTYVNCLGTALRELGREAFQSLADMFVFDSLIVNTDRHLTNFGILRGNATGRPVALAPIFDNGRSLFFSTSDDNCTFSNFSMETRVSTPKWPGASFDSMAARLVGERQKAALARLDGFALEQHPVYQVSQHRLDALNGFLHQRVETLLEMPTVDHELLAERLAEIPAPICPIPRDIDVVLGGAVNNKQRMTIDSVLKSAKAQVRAVEAKNTEKSERAPYDFTR